MAEVQDTEVAPKAKRNETAAKFYITPDGEGRHASPAATHLEFRFANGGPVRRYELSQFPEGVQACFALNGLAQKGGDAYAGKSGQDAIDAHDAVIETLMGGEWVKKGEGIGVPSTILFEVYCTFLRGMGKASPDTDEGKVKIAEYIKELSKEERKALLADPQIAALYAQYKAERAIAQAKTAKAAAKGYVGGEVGSDQFE